MSSLLNTKRPPVFCPGCSHDLVVHALDSSLQALGLKGEQVVIVSDIGCAGLFDTFFHTHAFHGLHGRALTYATGLKMARPDCTVIVVMGDGGLGIGGAHVLSSCRRNLDITLLVLNNFNYGMTGGQCSATTQPEAKTVSGFLNRLEAPLDICQVAEAAGATYLDRQLANDKTLPDRMSKAIRHPGFSLMDIWGICPGRYAKRNKINFSGLQRELAGKKIYNGMVAVNSRKEYASHYLQLAKEHGSAAPQLRVEKTTAAKSSRRCEILILGAAGQFINTAGEILCLSAMSGGLQVSMKSDYPITVLRGHSVCEIVMDRESIEYTGISRPTALLCVAQEGVNKRKKIFSTLDKESIIIAGSDLQIPESKARLITCDFKEKGVKSSQKALAGLILLSQYNDILSDTMLIAGIQHRYKGARYSEAVALLSGLGVNVKNSD